MSTPADELRAAAFQLRNPFHLPGLKVGIDSELAAPLADWLDASAIGPVVAVHSDMCPDPNCDINAALAVARAINGPR